MKQRAGDTFFKMYTEDWMSIRDIAESYGCTRAYVHSELKKCGYLPLPRYPNVGYDNPELRKKENFIALLKRHLSGTSAAKEVGITHPVLRAWCKFHGVKLKKLVQGRRGADHHSYKRGSFKDAKGYLRTSSLEYRETLNPDWKSDNVTVHTLVMEKHIGFALPNGYVVHHINEDKADNRLENLAVLTIGQHVQIHSLLDRKNFPEKTIAVTRRLSDTNIESLRARRDLQQLLNIYQAD